LEFIGHTAPNTTGRFTFEWVAPASDVGPVRVFVAGNGANGNRENTGDQIYTNNFTLTPSVSAQPPAIRAEQPVLQAFSGMPGVSPGTWIEIYGSNLSTATREWAGSDFTENGTRAPTQLEGVRVNVAGRPAFVRYVSPTQVNVQVPDDIGIGDVEIEVINAAGRSTTQARAANVSPALLTTAAFNVGGRQYLAALHTDQQTFVGRPNLISGVPFRPARPGDTILIYAVGCGATNPASPAGQVVSAVRPLAAPFEVRFGETAATGQAFIVPSFVGLCRFDITVPNVADGDIRIDASVGSTATGQTLWTTVQR
jgi:uncharacterized protein (TIGR03437 family)